MLVVVLALMGRVVEAAPVGAEPPPLWDATVPRVSIGVLGQLDLGIANLATVELAAAARLLPWLYADAQVVLTGESFLLNETLEDEAAYGGSLGASLRQWRRYGMLGVRATVGYARFDYVRHEELEDTWHPASDRGAFAELAGLAALRLTPYVALEVRVELRQWARTEGDGRSRGGGAALGLHVTL